VSGARVVIAVCGAIVMGGLAATPAYADGGDSSAYLNRLNAERTAHGLPALAADGDLTAVAQQWAAHMAATGVLAHNPQLATQVTGWHAVGENVGDGPTVADLDAAFWASPEHRANILDPTYDDIGVGSARGDGVLWISVVFRDDLEPAPTPVSTASPTPDLAAVPAASHPRLAVRVDGSFGQVTCRAVMRFQRRHHLRVDGIVGPRTRAVLRRVFAPPPVPPPTGRVMMP
jgi:peptidoglycan hydrolase-like protein with peptidoglycan-binding domain